MKEFDLNLMASMLEKVYFNFPDPLEIKDCPIPIKAKPGELVTMRSEFYWKVSEDGKYLIRLQKILTRDGHEYREVESGEIFEEK